MAETHPAPASLEQVALQGVLEGLHSLTSSKACSFTGSGKIQLSDPVRISVSPLNGSTPFTVSFPGTKDLSPLIEACSSASFGKGPLQVYDQSYRNALELSPKEFLTDFSLAEHDILPQIARLTNTEGANLTAKLYKFNMYRPGDFFKSHLDTPRAGLIGSLVVCLPHEHTGGILKVRHLNTEVKFDWGKPEAVQWAFFYSDCEHEVQEVTSGCRITLAYNLYSQPARLQPSLNLELSPLGVRLRQALDSAAFLPSGGKLGFALNHLYSHTSHQFDVSQLKGSDAAIQETARQLGLHAEIRPVWEEGDDSDEYCYSSQGSQDEAECQKLPQGCWKSCPVPDKLLVGGPLALTVSDADPEYGGQLLRDKLGLTPGSFDKSKDIMWINGRFQYQLGLVALAYGNEWSIDTAYSAAALIVDIKPWDQRHN